MSQSSDLEQCQSPRVPAAAACTHQVLGHVVPDAVRQDHRALLPGLQPLGRPDGHRHGRAGRAPAEEPLLPDEAAGHLERVLVHRLVPLVHHAAVQDVGDKVVADALDQVGLVVLRPVQRRRLRQDGALRVAADDNHAGAPLPQLLGDAGDGAAGPGARHHHVHAAAQRLQDLLGRPEVVGQRVGRVRVLVEDVTIGDLRVEPPGHADVGLRGVRRRLGRRPDDLRPQGAQDVRLLLGHLLRHADDAAVAPDGGRQRESDAGVPRGGLDQSVAGVEAAALLRVQHHLHADAVLDAAPGVQELALRPELALQALRPLDVAEPACGARVLVSARPR